MGQGSEKSLKSPMRQMSAASQRLANVLKELATITSGHLSSAQTRYISDIVWTNCVVAIKKEWFVTNNNNFPVQPRRWR